MQSALTLILIILSGIVELARSGSYGVPFPVRIDQTEYIKNIALLRCGGNVNNPVVIVTRNYPNGNSGTDRCIWKIRTRKCFTPKLSLLSKSGYDSYWTQIDLQFGDELISLMDKPDGFVYYAPSSDGTLTFQNRLGWGGYGFQMLVDFIPRSTPECLAEFTEQSTLTCVSSSLTKNSFVIQSPEYPVLVDPGTACKHTFPVDDDLRSYEIKITSNVTAKTRLELNDMFTSEKFNDLQTSKTISIIKPFDILYRSDDSVATPGFKMEIKQYKDPAPCGTTVKVGETPIVLENPYTRTCKVACAIKFESSIENKKLSFDFSSFKVNKEIEAGRLIKDYPTMNDYVDVNENSGTIVTSAPVLLAYKAISTNSLWKLTVSTTD